VRRAGRRHAAILAELEFVMCVYSKLCRRAREGQRTVRNHWNEKGIHDRVFLAYSRHESFGSAELRVLIFNPDDRLIEREADYYR
jgi:hypothetical protein